MADYQRVVEFLRDFRTSQVQTVTDEVREAAAEYAALCAAANDRLRQCNVLLQRGLRAEAINQADAAPNLLDLVAALDLPDPEGWAEFCQRSELPVPAALQIERAAQLNDAYGQDQPLEQLFMKHRRLALSQAPVARRLAVMREIAQLDPSPFWEKDIRTFEHARVKELRVTFSAAVKNKDVKAVQALSAEVLDSAWLEPVPADLAAAARDVKDRVRLAQFDQSMNEIVGKLRTAFAAKSLTECVALLKQAKELAAAHSAGLPVEAASVIEAASAWAHQENQARANRQAYMAACDALHQALNMDVPDRELDAAYRAAAGHDQPVPPELQERYAQTVARRAKSSRRKYVLALAGVAAVLLVALGVVYSFNQSRLATGWADKIHRAAADRDLALAKQVVAEQERVVPKFNDSPPVAAAKREVAVLQDNWDRDAAALKAALESLEAATRQATVAAAAGATLDDVRAAQSAADDALARRKVLADLSWVDPDKSLAKATARLEGMRNGLQGRLGQDVVARAQGVGQRAEAVPVEPRAATLAAAETALAGLEQELTPLWRFAHKGSAEEEALQAAARAVSEKRDAARRARAESDARRALAAAAGSAASSKEALLDFAKRFPDSTLSRDLAKAAAAADLYASVETWHTVSGAWGADAAPATDKVAAERIDAVAAFLRDHPTSPVAGKAAAYADYLRQASVAMVVKDNPWQSATADAFGSPLISDLRYLQASDGVRYLVLGDPHLRKQSLNDRVTYSFEAMDPQNLARPKQVIVPPPRSLVSEKPALVAHAQFVQTLAEQMKTVDRGNWDTWGVETVSRVAADDKIDPVVKGVILRDLLKATAQVDRWALGDLYDKPYNDLVRQRLDQVVWYDPERPVPEVTIANLRRIFESIPKAADVKQRVIAKRAEMAKSLQPAYAGSGLLLRDDEGKWTIHTPAPARPGAVAWAIVPPADLAPAGVSPVLPATGPAASQPAAGVLPGLPLPADPAGLEPVVNPAKMVRVAQWPANGPAVVDEPAARAFPEGTMVLISRP